MRAYGIRAARMSTCSPRNGTPSASSSARWRAPLASEPSARTIRHHGTSWSVSRAARCRRSAARRARRRRRRARSPRASSRTRAQHGSPSYRAARCAMGRIQSWPSIRRPASSAWRCSRTGSPSARCARGRGRGSARWRRSRSSSPPTGRTRSTGSPTASARSRRSASCSPPTRWPHVRQVAVIDARGGIARPHRARTASRTPAT